MIRAARKSDCQQVVPLIQAAIGTIANTIAGSDDENKITQVLEAFFQQEENRLSYQNTTVMELDGRIVGFFISYHGSKMEKLDQPLVEHLIKQTGNPNASMVKEARDDEYYLDSLAVDESCRGSGFGRELMHAFEQQARRDGYTKLALIVETNNQRAYHLYEKMGYKQDGSILVSGHDYYHMVKYVESS